MDINGIAGRTDINEVMSKIREVSNKSKIFVDKNIIKESGSFEDVLSIAKNALTQVNNIQTSSDSIKSTYISGEGNVSMSQVIVASQKSKLAFEGLLAVRNKILESYKEIMNMPI